MFQISNPVTPLPWFQSGSFMVFTPVLTGSQFVPEHFSLFISIIQNELRSRRSDLPRTGPAPSSTPGPDSNQVLCPTREVGQKTRLESGSRTGLERTCAPLLLVLLQCRSDEDEALMSYLRRGRACSCRGQREDSVRPGSWAAVNRDCRNRWQSGTGPTGPRRCPPGPSTPSDSTAPSRPGSAPWKVRYDLFLRSLPCISMC